jgi:hypothetical protein
VPNQGGRGDEVVGIVSAYVEATTEVVMTWLASCGQSHLYSVVDLISII